MKKTSVFVLSVVIMLFFMFSCSNNSIPATGSFTIVLGNNVRAIEPNISLETVKYQITVKGPDSSYTEEVAASVSVISKKDIPAGDYTVTVKAINRDNVVIGEGSKTLTITPNNTTEVTIEIKEVAGNGKLTVTLDGNIISSYTYKLTVYDSKESKVGDDIEFSLEDSAWKADAELPNGFYYFIVSDGNGTVSEPEAFRIVKNDQIEATAYVYSKGDGSFRFTITNSIVPNPELHLSVSSSVIHAGDTVIVSASGMSGDNLTYSWYIDGVKAEGQTGSQISFSKNVAGDYSVKCLVRDASSSIVWSASRTVVVYNPGYKPMSLQLDGDVEFWCIGDVLIPGSMNVSVLRDDNELYSFQYGQGHRSFQFEEEVKIACNLSGADGYTYYLEPEETEGRTIVYIVIDKEIANPAYVKVNFDYDYIFKRDRNEYRGFYLCFNEESTRGANSGFVSLTNNKSSRTVKVKPGYYRQNGTTGNNSSIWPSVTPRNFTLSSGQTAEITVTIPYASVILENFDGEAGYYGISLGDYGVDWIYVDEMDGKKAVLLSSNIVGYGQYSIWKAFSPDYRYDFSTTAGIGETQNVSTVKNEIDWVDTGVTVPAGRTLFRITSSVVLDRAFHALYWKTVTQDDSLDDSREMDLRWSYWSNPGQNVRLYCTDISGLHDYTYTCSMENQNDEYGAYNLVTVNIDEKTSDYATVKITYSFDESLLERGTYISVRRTSDGKMVLVPVCSEKSSEYKIEPGTYRYDGYWNSMTDPATGKTYAPRIAGSFTCVAGEVTELEVFVEERN